MTTKPRSKTKTKSAVTTKKVTTATKRAVKRERMVMIDPSPSAPVAAEPVVAAKAPVAVKPVVASAKTPVAVKPVVAASLLAAKAPVATPVLAKATVAAKAPVAAPALAAKTPVTVPVLAAAKTSVVETAPVRTISRAELEELVRLEAFRLAQRRQFRGGSQVQDWFAAENLVKTQLAARGFAVH